MVTESGDLVVVAIHRRDDELTGETTLEAGDTLLLEGAWGQLDYHLGDPEVLVVDEPAEVRRQAVPLGPGAGRAVAVLGAMIVLLAFDLVPPAVAGLLAAGAIVVSRVLTIQQAYRGIQWTTVILIAGMIPLGAAMTETGAAGRLADGLVDGVGGLGPRALLAGLAVLVFVLGQLISNTATVLVVTPIALSAAADLDVSAKPVLMAVCVASAAAFLTPIATPGEPDGDGARRLPFRRLLEARAAAARALRARGRGAGPGVLAPLETRRRSPRGPRSWRDARSGPVDGDASYSRRCQLHRS